MTTLANFEFILPEMAAHLFLTVMFLLTGQWITLLLNIPLAAYNVNKYDSLLLLSPR